MEINRQTATLVTLPNLPTFTTANLYPLERIRNEVQFAIAQRVGEVEAAGGPSLNNWINDAYTQILGMTDSTLHNCSTRFTLPAATSVVALPGEVYNIITLSALEDGKLTPLQKSIDVEYWRSVYQEEAYDKPLYNYFMYRDAGGLLLQFHKQSVPVTLVLDAEIKPRPLVANTDCPALEDAVCVGLIDMAISIAMRRLGQHTHAGVQNNAALGIIRSVIDQRAEDRKGTVAAVSRPRSREELRGYRNG